MPSFLPTKKKGEEDNQIIAADNFSVLEQRSCRGDYSEVEHQARGRIVGPVRVDRERAPVPC